MGGCRLRNHPVGGLLGASGCVPLRAAIALHPLPPLIWLLSLASLPSTLFSLPLSPSVCSFLFLLCSIFPSPSVAFSVFLSLFPLLCVSLSLCVSRSLPLNLFLSVSQSPSASHTFLSAPLSLSVCLSLLDRVSLILSLSLSLSLCLISVPCLCLSSWKEKCPNQMSNRTKALPHMTEQGGPLGEVHVRLV